MSTNVKVDAIQAAQVFNAWGKLPETTGTRIGMRGPDMLDGGAYSLLKAEFLAAQAGVVPFVPLPGGGQGVLTVGAALAEPNNAWPQPELRHLYMLTHRGMVAMHGDVEARRPATPLLPIPQTGQMEDVSHFVISGTAIVVIAAVGILATMAATYYATRTKTHEIEVNADLAKQQHQIGSLTDLAQQQLVKTGKIDPNLVRAIGNVKGGGMPSYFWPGVALGAGGIVTLGAGIGYAWSQKGRRRR